MISLALPLLLGVALGIALSFLFARPLGVCDRMEVARWEHELRKPAP